MVNPSRVIEEMVKLVSKPMFRLAPITWGDQTAISFHKLMYLCASGTFEIIATTPSGSSAEKVLACDFGKSKSECNKNKA